MRHAPKTIKQWLHATHILLSELSKLMILGHATLEEEKLIFFGLFFHLCTVSFFFNFIWFISHGCTCVPHPKLPSHLPPHQILQGHPSAPTMTTLSHASNLDWQSISHMIIYMFQCYSLKSSHPLLLPQSPKVCSLSLCLFYGLAYRVIITISLNSIHMC